VVGPVRAEPVDASPFQAAQGEARRLSLARDRHRLWGGLDRQRKSPPATPPEGWPILPAYFQLTGALRANIIYVTGNIRSGEKCHIYGEAHYGGPPAGPGRPRTAGPVQRAHRGGGPDRSRRVAPRGIPVRSPAPDPDARELRDHG